MIRGAVPERAHETYIQAHLAISALYDLTHVQNLISEAAVAPTPKAAREHLQRVAQGVGDAMNAILTFERSLE